MKKALFRVLMLMLVVALLLPCAVFAADEIGVSVYGEPVVWTDAKPFIDENNRTLVPLRAVADALGIEVEWDGEYRYAHFYTEADLGDYDEEGNEIITGTYRESIYFYIDSDVAECEYAYFWKGGMEDHYVDSIQMDTAAIIVNDRTYAPIRYLAEFFGYNVDWDAETRTVLITDPAYESVHAYIDMYNNSGSSVGFYLYPGELYAELADIDVVVARVNGEPAKIERMGEEEFAAFTSDFSSDAILAFEVLGTYELEKYYEFMIDFRLVYNDGTEEISTAYYGLEVYGYGGW